MDIEHFMYLRSGNIDGLHRRGHPGMRYPTVQLSLIAVLALCSGCAKQPQRESDGQYGLGANWAAPHMMAIKSSEQPANATIKRPSSNATLAYVHTLTVDTDESVVPSAVKRVSTLCTNDRKNNCEVLATSVSKGEYGSGNVRLRINPAGVDAIIAAAAAEGTISRRETTAEDLSDAITDTDTRMKMLTTYRDRLQALESQSKSNIDALIKVTSELASVQSDIERATRESETQRRRVNTEIVKVDFDPQRHRAFWRPIREALESFASSLSAGIASAIVGVAFLLPWLVIAVPAFVLARVVWRRTRSR